MYHHFILQVAIQAMAIAISQQAIAIAIATSVTIKAYIIYRNYIARDGTIW